jgi:hypothetical protein
MAGHPDLNLSLVTLVCLLGAWGPIFAAIAYGIAAGFGDARHDRETRPARRLS